jgi:hypothetical protein
MSKHKFSILNRQGMIRKQISARSLLSLSRWLWRCVTRCCLCAVCVEVSKVLSSSNLRHETVLWQAIFIEKTIGLQSPRDIRLGNNSKANEFVFHNSSLLHYRLISWYSCCTRCGRQSGNFLDTAGMVLYLNTTFQTHQKSFFFYSSPDSLLVLTRHIIP